MELRDFYKLCVSVIVCELAGLVGAFYTMPAISSWYFTLSKSALNPPSWLFGPVWMLLYLLMGISVYLIAKKGWKRADVKAAIFLFIAQLAFNVAWSVIFFGLQNPFSAYLEIIALWVTIVSTMIIFYRIHRPAMYLLIPYILWVTFAVYLNYTIAILN